jgi:hypothetical protein
VMVGTSSSVTELALCTMHGMVTQLAAGLVVNLAQVSAPAATTSDSGLQLCILHLGGFTSAQYSK